MESIKCSLCEQYKHIDNFNNDKTAPDTRYNRHYWCKDCFMKKQKTQSYHRPDSESRFITRLVGTCKSQAKIRGKRHPERGECSIDRMIILRLKEQQNNRCTVSGVELEWKHRCQNKVSVDRIDCTRGYTEDNIRLVTQQVNYALSNFDHEWFFDMCKNVVIHNRLLNSKN
jgi:uncharacterized protein YlaI